MVYAKGGRRPKHKLVWCKNALSIMIQPDYLLIVEMIPYLFRLVNMYNFLSHKTKIYKRNRPNLVSIGVSPAVENIFVNHFLYIFRRVVAF